MIPMPSGISLVILTAHGVAKTDKMRGPLSTTWGQYIISWALYATNVLDVLWWCWTPSTNMDATPVPIKAVSPERATQLAQSGVHPKSKGDVIYWSPFPRKARILEEEGVDCHSVYPTPPADEYFSSQLWPELLHNDATDHNQGGFP